MTTFNKIWSGAERLQRVSTHACLMRKLAESLAADAPAWQANYLMSSILMKVSYTARGYLHAVMLCVQVGKEALQHLQPFKMTDNNSKLAIRADWLHQLQVRPHLYHKLYNNYICCDIRITSVCLLTEHPDKAA